ncbi:MAG: glycosyltransferase [Candidatus Dojkabacteria bacterium]|nr:MAG: glycosyltransferase [Candidatus Dojkabacteria bacterium]
MSNKVVLITSYPAQGALHSKGVGGLASFAKNTVNSIEGFEFTILADQIGDTEELYKEGLHTIKRVWKRGSYSTYPRLIRELAKLRDGHKKLMIQFEFGIFGGEIVSGFFPTILIAARVFGYKVILVQHQVVTDVKSLSSHLGISTGPATSVRSLLTKLYLKLNCLLSDKIVVFDLVHKERLSELTSGEKIYVIPHGVEQKELDNLNPQWPTSLTGGFDLDKFNLMTFGFIAWYKGTDWLAQNFNKFANTNHNADQYQLLIAGGESPTQRETPTYQKYYKEFLNEAGKNRSQIFHTGFVEERDIAFYFMESDLVVLPYRVLMSSSGPLSLAFTYEKPFILSEVLEPYTRTADFESALHDLGINKSDFIFSLDKDDLFDKVERIKNDSQLLEKLTELSRRLKQSRSWEKIGDEYRQLLAD